MKDNYKNESNKLFDKCSKNENIMLAIYVVNIIFMILVCYDINEGIISILNYGLIILNIIYIILSGYNDMFLKNKAERELRKTMISNSFNVNITTTKSEDYYSNDIEPSVEKMGINSFESTLYTNKITEKLIYRNIIKLTILVILWIVSITKIENLEIICLLTQIIFSTDILLDLIKIIYYHNNVNRLFEEFYKIFVTDDYKEKDMPIVIEYVMEYECLKNYCHIVLPNNIFNNEKEDLARQWEAIRRNIENKEV